MRLWRKKPPSGEKVSEDFANGMQTMETWYHEFVIWAYAYISLLEKRLNDRDCNRCGKCQQSDDEGDDGEREENV